MKLLCATKVYDIIIIKHLRYNTDILRCDFWVSWEYFHRQRIVYIILASAPFLYRVPSTSTYSVRLEDSIFEHKNQLCPDMPEGIVRMSS